MNAVRTIVEEGILTALIVEDDMDWDVRLKSQLKLMALGTRHLQYTATKTSPPPGCSPYGNEWDILWLGHCGEVFPEQLEENASKSPTEPDLVSIARKYIIHPDFTVPPPEYARGFQNFSANPFTRWVHISGGLICSFAYVLSLEGARKVLYDISADRLAWPFDNALAGLSRWGRREEMLGMRCLSITPPLFVHHRAKGLVGGDSDIQLVDGGESRDVSTTENIVWSARANVRGVITGDTMHSQFN